MSKPMEQESTERLQKQLKDANFCASQFFDASASAKAHAIRAEIKRRGVAPNEG